MFQIKMLDKGDFSEVYSLLEMSFPDTEIRDFEGQLKVLDNPYYRLLGYYDEYGEELIGVLAYWAFEEFTFIEHFAVSPKKRGGGIGSSMLRSLVERVKTPIFLEVEPCGATEFAERRIDFYSRLGFRLNTFHYLQLPLRKNQEPMRLCIMSYPNEVDEVEFGAYKEKIYGEVYNGEKKY